ncbi:MAG: SRPBCC domain-containing protein [Elusimicrobia bacterium]|nr:SRPBCC domain-containing protein [Elusimicrobiota bacterium]MDE2237717.1 SRPBCC domain-containing protein [Elusimicrobiota bacterium]MDE2425253.1 SRPBCC domain-containing protein [Elusimicrobiota bacterium]
MSPALRGKLRDLRFVLRIKAKPEQVYRALTSATELCRWWLQGAETDARNVGRFRMVWPKVKSKGAGGRAFPPHGVAMGDSEGYFVDLEPGRKVAWLWKLPRRCRYPALASFFIQSRGAGCEVTLIHAGFSSSPSCDKAFQGCAAGWEDCLAKLKLYLETGRTLKAQPLSFKAAMALRRKR